MVKLKFQKPKKKRYGSLRVWASTKDQFKMLAVRLDLSIVELMEHLAIQLKEQLDAEDQPIDELSVPANSEPEAKSVEDTKAILPNAGGPGVKSPKEQSVSTPVPRQD